MSGGHEQGNEPHHWRGTIRDIDPDVVYRSVRIAGGFRSWEDPPRTLYQVVTTTVEVHESAEAWTLLISGATADRVRDTAARLGYRQADVDLQQVSSLVALPRPVREARMRKADAAL